MEKKTGKKNTKIPIQAANRGHRFKQILAYLAFIGWIYFLLLFWYWRVGTENAFVVKKEPKDEWREK